MNANMQVSSGPADPSCFRTHSSPNLPQALSHPPTTHAPERRAQPVPGSTLTGVSHWLKMTLSMLRKSLLSFVLICSCNQRGRQHRSDVVCGEKLRWRPPYTKSAAAPRSEALELRGCTGICWDGQGCDAGDGSFGTGIAKNLAGEART